MMIKHEPEEVVICGYCNEVVKSGLVYDGYRSAHDACALIAEKRRDKSIDYMAELKQYRLEKEASDGNN